MKEYLTANEYRAHCNGAGEVINFLQQEISKYWILGRDDYDLTVLRDQLNTLLANMAEYVSAAQKLESIANTPQPIAGPTSTPKPVSYLYSYLTGLVDKSEVGLSEQSDNSSDG